MQVILIIYIKMDNYKIVSNNFITIKTNKYTNRQILIKCQ